MQMNDVTPPGAIRNPDKIHLRCDGRYVAEMKAGLAIIRELFVVGSTWTDKKGTKWLVKSEPMPPFGEVMMQNRTMVEETGEDFYTYGKGFEDIMYWFPAVFPDYVVEAATAKLKEESNRALELMGHKPKKPSAEIIPFPGKV